MRAYISSMRENTHRLATIYALLLTERERESARARERESARESASERERERFSRTDTYTKSRP